MVSIIIAKQDRDFIWNDEMVQSARRFVQTQQDLAMKLQEKTKKSEGL